MCQLCETVENTGILETYLPVVLTANFTSCVTLYIGHIVSNIYLAVS